MRKIRIRQNARKPPLERLLSKIRVDDKSGCWEWTAAKDKQGYGQFSISHTTQKSHRVSYDLHIAPVPKGMQVLHKCDNPGCINPEHLFLGTNDDNVDDKLAKGRHRCPRGGEHALAKLTEAQVVEIRNTVGLGTVIAVRYGVSPTTVSQIRSRKIWKHI